MWTWLKSRFSKTPRRLEIVRRDPFRVTIEEWRANGELVTLGARALREPVVRQMLDTLRNSNLTRYVGKGTLEERALHLERCQGYLACLGDFEMLGTLEPEKKDVPATFEPMEEEP